MSVTDEAILKIKDMIVSGELSPGDRLPPEQQLSERLGLSRSSLREAVKALEMIRVLHVRRGDGTYVTTLDSRLLLETLAFVTDLHDDSSVLEILAVRRILEPAAAAKAATLMDEEGVALLRAELAKVSELTSIEELVERDVAFHGIICRSSGNSYLANLIDGLSSRTTRARIWRGLTQDNAVEQTLQEHQAIVDALERGDADLAFALMTVHVSGVEQWLRGAL